MKEKIDALKETFLLLPEWADRYNYLVDLVFFEVAVVTQP